MISIGGQTWLGRLFLGAEISLPRSICLKRGIAPILHLRTSNKTSARLWQASEFAMCFCLISSEEKGDSASSGICIISRTDLSGSFSSPGQHHSSASIFPQGTAGNSDGLCGCCFRLVPASPSPNNLGCM